MSSTHRRLRRLLVVGAVTVGVVLIVRRRVGGEGPLPVIGGDTWPPVPVKDARTA
jgi:hypothetical protein